MKKNATRRALLLSVLSLMLCVSMLIGTTFAWFTDSVVSGNNRIIAGNLDVDVLYEDADGNQKSIQDVDTLFNDVTLWEPGAVAWENLTVVNLGSLALKFEFAVNFSNENYVEGSESKLSDILQIAVVEGGVDKTMSRQQMIDSIDADAWTPLSELYARGELYPADTEGKDSSKVYGVVIYWEPGDQDNEYNLQNGKKTNDGLPLHIDLGIGLTAWQQTYENDSYGPDYDAGQGVSHVASISELQDALLAGEDVVLVDDIEVNSAEDFMYTDSNGALLYLYHVDVTIDLNGHDIVVGPDALKEGKSNANAVLLVHYSTLNIVGEGSIIAENKSIPVYGWAHSEINIYGGTFKTNAHERNESAVYVNNPNVTINVYGGDFSQSVYDFNAHDSKCGNTPVIVLHEGVTYNDFYKGTTNLINSDMDAGRIVLADGTFVKNTTDENGEPLHQVTTKQDDVQYTPGYDDMIANSGSSNDYVLTDDMTAGDRIFFRPGTTNSIDLNNKNITAGNTNQYIFIAQSGGKLTLNGDGVVDCGKGFMASQDNVEIEINGGTYNSTVCDTLNSMSFHSLAQNNAKIVVNDGVFTSNVDNAAIFMATSNARIEINGGFFENTADKTPDLLSIGTNRNNVNRIIITGGTFVNYNPLNDQMCYTGAWPAAGEAAFGGPWILIPGGYTVVSETQANGDIWYSVVPVV